jgi:hypothetical protein
VSAHVGFGYSKSSNTSEVIAAQISDGDRALSAGTTGRTGLAQLRVTGHAPSDEPGARGTVLSRALHLSPRRRPHARLLELCNNGGDTVIP